MDRFIEHANYPTWQVGWRALEHLLRWIGGWEWWESSGVVWGGSPVEFRGEFHLASASETGESEGT